MGSPAHDHRVARPSARSDSLESVISTSRTQVIRVSPSATSYEGWCERCLDDATPQSIGVRWLRVDGALPLGIDAAVARCHRGHRIAVRRLGRLTDAA
jgi:hypothetical protein